jgi:hypothetical protein
MSPRRKPGEVVRREPGSGFVASSDPQMIRVPSGHDYSDQADPCMMGCSDPECREWANLEIVEGPHAGQFIYHISECEMLDADPESM